MELPRTQRILFVDDEQAVLDGLRRSLRVNKHWQIRTARSGDEALALLGQGSFDAVVTDIRMPRMSGHELLLRVRDQYPEVVRLVLSAHTDPAVLSRCVGVAHQCLTKPCATEALTRTVQRSIRLEAQGASKAVRELVGRMDRLPTIPAVYAKMMEVLADPEASVEDIGRVVEKDAGLSAKLLQIVNSAFFGLSRRISNPVSAVTYLGIETIKSLVLSMDVFSSYASTRAGGVNLSEEWRHGLDTADLARRLVRHHGGDSTVADEAFTAALLHDAGRLVLACNRPAEYEQVQALVESESISVPDAEDRVFGCSHAEVGGYLFGLWGLPPSVVEAIASHHRPDQEEDTGLTPLLAVHAANILDRDAAHGGDGWKGRVGWNTVFLQSRGFAERVEEWQALRDEWVAARTQGG